MDLLTRERSKARYLAFILFILSVLVVHPSRAQSQADLARQYLTAINSGSVKQTLLVGVRQQLDQTFGSIAETHSSEEAKRLVEHYKTQVYRVYSDQLDWAAVENHYVNHIESIFSKAELKKAIRFLKSDLGKKVRATQFEFRESGVEVFKVQSGLIEKQLGEQYTELALKLRDLRSNTEK